MRDGRRAAADRSPPRDLRPHPPRRPPARRRSRRVGAAGRGLAGQQRLLGLRGPLPRPWLGRAVLAGRGGRGRRGRRPAAGAAARRRARRAAHPEGWLSRSRDRLRRAPTGRRPDGVGLWRHQARREARGVAGDAVAHAQVEHALLVMRVLDEQVGARMLDRHRAPVDRDRAAPVEDGPHRARLVGPAVGALAVGSVGTTTSASGSSSGRSGASSSRSTPSSSWMASSVSS